MTSQPAGLTTTRGLDLDVVVAGCFFSVSAGLAAAAGTIHPDPPSVMLLVGWPAFALAGGVLLDRGLTALGRVMTLLTCAVALDLAWATLAAGGVPHSADLAGAVAQLATLEAVVVGFAISWGFGIRIRVPWAGLALAGAALAVTESLRPLGWGVAAVAWVGHLAMTIRGSSGQDRQRRRRTGWVLFSLSLVALVIFGAHALLSDAVANDLTGFGLWVLALVLARLALVTDYRPPAELWIDLLVVLVALGAAAVVGALVRVGVGMTSLQSPDTFAIFSAVVTAAFALPAGVRVRRTLLARRYGSGTLSPADVADITADLHARTEPRDLLDKAARMVAAASGSPQVRIVLGEEAEAVPAHWTEHPLVVGNDRVGTLLVESAHLEGPERRQLRVVEQLLPTVALVARAVGLAVEAEHARSDVARERDSERARILADLHDGLGPVLAGMSMRVQAGMRTATGPQADLLGHLARDLATSRTDLRRIVGGITPSVLDHGDLEAALSGLVRSFQGAGGPTVSLDLELAAPVPAPMQVTVYRCVAEGITNALRHAQPRSIDVRLCSDAEQLHVEVLDDGTGGSLVPGVGLTSLTHRAESAGGTLTVTPREAGTCLHLALPLRDGTER